METSERHDGRRSLVTLFFTTLYISAFTFGGGFVIVSFMKKHFVDRLKWINDDEMLDLIAMAQSAPGAIAVNAAILVGWRSRGFWGMLTAVAGTILPPVTIISVISLCYAAFASNRYVSLMLTGMRAGVAAVIMDVTCDLGAGVIKTGSPIKIIFMAAAFIAAFAFGINAVIIILAALVLGLTVTLAGSGKEHRDDIS